MSDIRDFQTQTSNPAVGRTDAAIDQGLRSYMLKVYNLMALGVALTGLVAYAFAEAAFTSTGAPTAFGMAIYGSPLRWVILLAPLALVFFLSFRIDKMSACLLYTSPSPRDS